MVACKERSWFIGVGAETLLDGNVVGVVEEAWNICDV